MRSTYNKLGKYLVTKRPLIVFVRVLAGMKRDDMSHLAAGFAYYALLSIFPLLIGFLAVMGLFINSDTFQRDFLVFVSEHLPGAGDFVTQNLLDIVQIRGVLSFSAIVIALFLGRSVFAAVSRSINRASGLKQDRPFYIAVPIQFALIIPIGSLFVLSNAMTSIFKVFSYTTQSTDDLNIFLSVGLQFIPALIISLLMFTLIYRFVPNRTMRWKWIWPGAIISTLLFELVKNAFVWYIESVPTYTQLYGALTSVVILMLWAYLSGLILMLGAKINYEYENVYFPEEKYHLRRGNFFN
ncbi:MAG: hypothetical protein CL886_04365 [Dehalococcoidia bacterium]|nr:hypothetical protein [Dehalococcoidia bacterium]